MLDWLIIGGGVHGTYLSLYLTRRKNVQPDRVGVLDPHIEPLALWNHFAANTGMEFLRSSHAHNLHFDPFSLVTFARTRAGQPLARFIEPYGRPSLELFQAHCRLLVERYHLDKLRLSGSATALKRLDSGWRLETEQGALEAHRVILAIGSTRQPSLPDWAQALQAAGAPVHHIFDPAFRRHELPEWKHAVVVGGGITAAQTAMTMALHAPGRVTLLMRHLPRIHQFDADTGWITPSYLDDFCREEDYARRRAIIVAARHRGSMPQDIADELDKAVSGGLLLVQAGEIVKGHCAMPRHAHHQPIELTLATSEILTADQVVLATGFDAARPGGAWLDAAIADYALPLAPDGYPLVDKTLRWSSSLYVTGPLAELEIGPVARNMVGVRLAAERIGAII
jgi:pyridine nucleotide-disulfide oxidoreductase